MTQQSWNELAGADPVDPTAGHRVMRPDEVVMAAEEAEDAASGDGVWDLVEVFRLVMCFVFFDKKSHEAGGWDYAAAALEVVYREFVPSVWYGMAVDESSRRRGVGLVSGADAGVHELLRRADPELLERVLVTLVAGLEGRLWVLELTRRFYGLAKLLDESLIGGASLEKLGDIFSEAKGKGARARWSERIQVVTRVLARGQTVRGRFQKGAEAKERMAQAQRGNQNRRKSEK